MDVIRLLAIRDTALSVDEVMAAVGDHAAGGTTLFVGTVREQDHGKPVTRLSYSAHPSAESELRTVAEKVAVAGPHRQEAFLAARRLIDDLKSQVPIWKHQVFADGSTEWVGACE